MPNTTILSLVNDLFFSVRIESTLGGAGYRVIGAAEPAIGETVAQERPALAIVDIGGFGLDWEAAIRTLKAADPALPVLAFGSHMDLAARERALAAGADRVVAKSQFVEGMATLVARLVRGGEDEDGEGQ